MQAVAFCSLPGDNTALSVAVGSGGVTEDTKACEMVQVDFGFNSLCTYSGGLLAIQMWWEKPSLRHQTLPSVS